MERLEQAWPPELADEREIRADCVPDKAVPEPHGVNGRTADRASEGASVLTTRELKVLRLVAARPQQPTGTRHGGVR